MYNWVVDLVIKKLRFWNLAGVAGCLAVGLGLWEIFNNRLPPQVPLWYSKPWGEMQLATPAWLLVIPTMGAMCGITLAWLSNRGLKNDQVLAIIFLTTSLVIQTMLMLGMLRIVLLVL